MIQTAICGKVITVLAPLRRPKCGGVIFKYQFPKTFIFKHAGYVSKFDLKKKQRYAIIILKYLESAPEDEEKASHEFENWF